MLGLSEPYAIRCQACETHFSLKELCCAAVQLSSHDEARKRALVHFCWGSDLQRNTRSAARMDRIHQSAE